MFYAISVVKIILQWFSKSELGGWGGENALLQQVVIHRAQFLQYLVCTNSPHYMPSLSGVTSCVTTICSWI